MQLVEQGKLELDVPINKYLTQEQSKEPFVDYVQKKHISQS